MGIKEWLIDNKDWLTPLTGVLVLIISIIALIKSPIARKIKNRKPKFTLDVAGAQFFTTIFSSDDHREKDTIIQQHRNIHNLTDDIYTVIKYAVTIKSPDKYERKLYHSLHEGDRYYFLPRSRERVKTGHVRYTTPLYHHVKPQLRTTGHLYYRLPFIVDKEIEKLGCKLEVHLRKENTRWFSRKRKVSLEYRVTRGN